MKMEPPPQVQSSNPLDSLSPEAKERLKKIESRITVDKITVSFIVEERRDSGGKRSAFYAATCSLIEKDEGEPKQTISLDDANLYRGLVSRHVILSTMDNAIRQGVINQKQGIAEARAIAGRYVKMIARLLENKEGSNGG